MYKDLKTLIITVALGISVMVPTSILANQRAASSRNTDVENATTTTVNTDDSISDSIDIKTRRDKIKQDLENLKSLSVDKKAKAEELVLSKVKQAALKAIDSTIKKLNKIKDRVAKMKNIDTSLKADLDAKIDARIAVLESKKVAIETATTKEKVKAALGGIQKEIRSTIDIIKDIVTSLHKTQLQNIIDRIQTLLDKLTVKVATQTGDKKTQAQKFLGDATTDLAKAKSDLTEGDFKKTKEDIIAAHKALSKVVEILKSNNAEGGSND